MLKPVFLHRFFYDCYKMKKVLIVSYVFPPMAAVGGFRVVKACKFLPLYDWQPVVLTVQGGFNYAYDEESLKQLDSSLPIYRSKYFSPIQWWDSKTQPTENSSGATSAKQSSTQIQTDNSLSAKIKKYIKTIISIPDIHNFWIPFAVLKGLQAIKNEKVDIILSTSPPASVHIIGTILSYLTGKPFVMDYRDLWTQNESYHNRNLPWEYKKVDRFYEKRAIKRASAIVSATTGFSNALFDNNRYKKQEQFRAITNGVDADDFSDIQFPTTKNEKFTILHLGSLYGNRNPNFFFEVLHEWVTQNKEVKDNIKVLFIGNTPGYEKSLIGTVLEPIVQFEKHIPQKQILPKLWASDLLLLILGFDPGGKNVMPAKLYEYICTKRPILGFLPEGMAADAIKKYNRGLAVTSEDKDKTILFLNEQFQIWKNQSGERVSQFDLPPEYDRKEQNKKLADILNNVLSINKND